MHPHIKPTSHLRRLRTGAVVLALSLSLAACGNSGSDSQNDAANSAHAAASASKSAASASNDAVVNSRAGVAVSTGISQAASFGFNTARGATAEELAELRKPPTDAMKGVNVIPDTCKQSVEDLNWSPAQSSDEAARTDFAQNSTIVTGSVEVAKLQDEKSFAAYQAAVENLQITCRSISLSIVSEKSADTYPFTAVKPATKADSSADGKVDSAILWTRGRMDQDIRQQSLVLVGQKDGYVAMVSFVGLDKITDKQFTEMAQAILKATLAGL
ncbi:hypothetical protein ACXA45_07820 [Neomicrococcus lactis]